MAGLGAPEEARIMTPVQSIEARHVVGWSQLRLAAEADQPRRAVAAFELGGPASHEFIAALRAALESAGVEFILENGGGPGVRLRT
jgi:hypothetical protein